MQEHAPDLLQWLATCQARIEQLENNARMCIAAEDTPGYVALMREKAEFLSQLSAQGAPLVEALPDSLRSMVKSRLERFSQGADQALALNSVFYMSALLFPSDHTPGQPNDLDVFVKDVASRL